MRQRVLDVIRIGDKLFAERYPILSLWQQGAENFHVMRADFTRSRSLSEEFASYLMTGRPALCHRDLANAFSAMLRPRDQQWFHARTESETINEDRTAKAWLDWASKRQRRAFYNPAAQFVRATKEGDGDFCLTGNAIITIEVCDYSHLLFRCWHPRDVAWDQDDKNAINTVHFNWRPQARQLQQKFKNTVSPRVAELKAEERWREIKCRRILIPAEDYDLDPKLTRNKKFVSVTVDIENETILEEVALRTLPVVLPRWATTSTSQYGYSPAMIYGLPDARMLQQIMLTILEAGQKVVDPPMIAVGEAIVGGTNLFAGGMTWVDADYDEKTGEVLRPITLRPEGLQFGAAREERIEKMLQEVWFLSKVQFPQMTKEMTATEVQRLYQDFVRQSLPLFEPVEVEYNAALCDKGFDILRDHGVFGAWQDVPQILRGKDVAFGFDTPIQEAVEKALTGNFQETAQLITEGMQMDPDLVHEVDWSTAARDAVGGTGSPPKWLRPPDQVAKLKAQAAMQRQAAQAAQAVAQGTDAATRMGNAAASAGKAASSLQDAGLM